MTDRLQVSESMSAMEALATLFPDSSNNKLRQMLKAGRVHIDGVETHAARQQLEPGQTVEVRQHGNPESLRIKAAMEAERSRGSGRRLEVIAEDEDILLVDKPAGLLTVATDKMEDDTLHARAQTHVSRNDDDAWAHIVHRLDRRTSGILVFAKSSEGKAILQSQFADRTIERVYHAVVEGCLEGEGTVRNHLFEDRNLRVFASAASKRGAREAITHWRAVAHGEMHTLVRLHIDTGRRHQIRVHMADLGHPVAGDGDHGARSDPFNRLLLHASQLGFDHPADGEGCLFEAPMPAEFRRLAPADAE